MLSKARLAAFVFSAFAFSDTALGRIQWLERDGRHVSLYPRRFAQEHPAVIDKLAQACDGGICATLAGQAITPLLAAQPECSQQDMADTIIDTAQQFDDITKATLIKLAKEYRQAEKNTPPDFTTNPPNLRNSVFCQKAPKNPELDGLVQAQDPANDPDLFFDPALGATVKKGDQPNTLPFGSSGSASSGSSGTASSTVASAGVSSSVAVSSSAAASVTTSASVPSQVLVSDPADTANSDPCVVTITVTASAADNTLAASSGAVTVTAGNTASASVSAPAATITGAAGNIGDFGSCSVPQIEFGVGFDNRKETSFQPTDKTLFDHGSAQNIAIITQFICDTLTNKCGADQTAKDTCAQATTAASTATAKTGAQADAFNAVFGIQTDFASIAPVDDQGRVVAGTDSGNNAVISSAAASVSATVTASAPAASATNSAGSNGSSAGIGDFGSCTTPEIEFGAGFDNRKETSFQPADKQSFNHDSAQNINIITQFICDTLTNSCGADQTAKDTCKQAQAAAAAATAQTGAQADAFNAVFGIQTDFASVAVIDNQGDVVSQGTTGNNAGQVSGGSNANAASSSVAAATTKAAAASATSEAAATSASSSAAPATTSQSSGATGGNLQTFTGALGNVTPPAVTDLGNGKFQVEGNSAFNSLSNALTRSCDVQHNQCANAANASGNKGDLTVAACGVQQQQCNAAVQQ